MVRIKCLTDGAIVLGRRLRAGQELEIDAVDAEISKLRVIEAAGDIVTNGLPDRTKEKPTPAFDTDDEAKRDA